jgi:hypothetical protein
MDQPGNKVEQSNKKWINQEKGGSVREQSGAIKQKVD